MVILITSIPLESPCQELSAMYLQSLVTLLEIEIITFLTALLTQTQTLGKNPNFLKTLYLLFHNMDFDKQYAKMIPMICTI